MKRLLLLLLAAASAHAGDTVDRRIAITIDDLPWAQMGDRLPLVPAEHVALMRALAMAKAPVTGFVNEAKLEMDGNIRPERVAMLRDWLDQRLPAIVEDIVAREVARITGRG